MEKGEDSSLAVDAGPPSHPELMAKAKKLVASLLSDLPSDGGGGDIDSDSGAGPGEPLLSMSGDSTNKFYVRSSKNRKLMAT